MAGGTISYAVMCGRYTLTTEISALADEFGLIEAEALAPRDNIAPTQVAPVVRLGAIDSATEPGDAKGRVRATTDAAAASQINVYQAGSGMAVVRQDGSSGGRRLDVLRWGLIPRWAKDADPGFSAFNARAETVATQPAFREAFKARRCIVPATGFYEWQKQTGAPKSAKKQPYHIRRADGRPLALAGLWERWTSADGEVVESFTIITTTPNEFMRELHDRMPVILAREDYDTWLNGESTPEQLQALLRPCPSEWLTATPVGPPPQSPRAKGPASKIPPSGKSAAKPDKPVDPGLFGDLS